MRGWTDAAVAATAACVLALAWAGQAQRLTLFGNENQPAREVYSCTQLKAALQDRVLSVQVAGDITCHREVWGNSVRINWNVEIYGKESADTGAMLPVLDWTDIRKGLVVQKGAVLIMHSLQLRQNSMGIGGIDFAFIETSKGATGVFSGVVMGVRSCPQPVVAYNEIAELIPRPDFLTGEQRTSALDDSTLVVEDIAIWWPEINSLWQICHAAFLCGADFEEAAQTAQNAIAHTTCMTPPLQHRLRGDSDRLSEARLKMLTVGIISLIAALLVLGVGFFYCRKRTLAKHRTVQDTPDTPVLEGGEEKLKKEGVTTKP